MLRRAIRTLWIVLDDLDLMYLPLSPSWRLNERHYGALQGVDKRTAAVQYGEAKVRAWRRGYADRPPALEANDPRHPRFDPRYARLEPKDLPAAESLADTLRRVLPYWETEIAPAVRNGTRVLVVAHGNSIRALVKHLDSIPDDAITGIEIPTGFPLVYELDVSLVPIRHYYLGDEAEVHAAMEIAAGKAPRTGAP